MTEIKILKSVSPKKLSDLYTRHITENKLTDQLTLVIPNEINKYTFGLLADLLRFVITINSRRIIRTLKIDSSKEAIDILYDQEYAYPIISLLWNTASFIDQNENDIKSLLREKQNSFFQKMNSLTRFKGNKFILTNTDHLPDNKGLIRLLENSNGFNDDELQISKNIKKILDEYVLTFNKNNRSEIDNITDDIGAIVYELAKNTFEWGRTDNNSVNILSSIRGIYLRFHINKNEKIVEEYANTPLSVFFNNPKLLKNSLNEHGQVYYLEIMVFDSGIGFVDRFYPRQELTDIDIIKKCLIKNQTSSTSNLKTKKGVGLDRILNILNRKGFLKICTDKYCAYRDLIKDEYVPTSSDNLSDLVLEDWNRSNFRTEHLTKSQGSYISILYPFKHTK